MADIRIKDLATTATTSASDDYLALDGSTNGTRKILATNVANNVTDVVFGASGPSAKSSIAARAARQGLVFDGTGFAQSSASLSWGTTDFTYSAWVKPTGVSGTQYVLSGYGVGSGTAPQFGLTNAAVSMTGGSSGGAYASSTGTLSAGKWAHVAYARTGGTGTFYINGVASGTASDSVNFNQTTSIWLGADGAGNNKLTGTMASPAVYNRALSAAEVVSLYEAGVPAGADYNTASNTSKLTGANSDFSSAGNWTVTGATAISGGKLNLSNGDQAYCTPGTISIPVGSKFKVTITVDSITAGSVQVYTGATVGWVNIATAPGTFTQEFTFYAVSGPLTTLNLKSTGGNAVVDTVLYYQIGLLLAPDAAQSGGGLAWYDTSGNAANITLPATGVTWNVPSSRYLGGNWTNTGTFTVKGPDNGSLYVDTSSATNYTSLYFRNNGGSNAAGLYHYTGDGSLTINSFGGNLIFARTTGEAARIVNSTGRFLLGTTTDSGALLQVGTNTTTSAGGMVFGTDTFLYRLGTSQLMVESGASGAIIGIAVSGTRKGYMYHNATDFFIDADAGIFNIRTMTANSIVLKTNNTTALTLDTSQNATFAGKVAVASGTAAAPTLTFSGDSDTGIYNPGGNQLSAACAGSQIWNTTTNGLSMAASKDIYLGNAYIAGAPTATGYVTIKDSAGVTYKVLVST